MRYNSSKIINNLTILLDKLNVYQQFMYFKCKSFISKFYHNSFQEYQFTLTFQILEAINHTTSRNAHLKRNVNV